MRAWIAMFVFLFFAGEVSAATCTSDSNVTVCTGPIVQMAHVENGDLVIQLAPPVDVGCESAAGNDGNKFLTVKASHRAVNRIAASVLFSFGLSASISVAVPLAGPCEVKYVFQLASD